MDVFTKLYARIKYFKGFTGLELACECTVNNKGAKSQLKVNRS